MTRGVVRALSSSQHDHIFAGRIGVEPLHQAGATLQARALIDEGVEVSPLPVLPDDRN